MAATGADSAAAMAVDSAVVTVADSEVALAAAAVEEAATEEAAMVVAAAKSPHALFSHFVVTLVQSLFKSSNFYSTSILLLLLPYLFVSFINLTINKYRI